MAHPQDPAFERFVTQRKTVTVVATPLAELIERETESLRVSEPDVQHSLAGAYVRPLRHFDNRRRAVADHLLIPVSHAYRHCAETGTTSKDIRG
jgi:hypothetical protein